MGKNLQSSRDVERGNYGHAESKRGPCMPIWAIILVSILVCAGLAVGLYFLLTLRKSEDSNATRDDAPGVSSNGTSAAPTGPQPGVSSNGNGTSAAPTGDNAPGASTGNHNETCADSPCNDAPGASTGNVNHNDTCADSPCNDAPGASTGNHNETCADSPCNDA